MSEILITSSALILAVILLRLLFRNKVSRGLIYGAWLLVALRLLIPVQIGELNFSILAPAKPVANAITDVAQTPVSGSSREEAYNKALQDYLAQGQTVFIPEVQQQVETQLQSGKPQQEIYDALLEDNKPEDILLPEISEKIEAEVDSAHSLTFGQMAMILWIAGMVAMAAWFAAVNLSFRRKLRSSATVLEVADCKTPVKVSPHIASPCLFGLLRPTIYLTPNCVGNDQTRQHVLTHELSHLRSGDHIWCWVRCICLCIYWFNPLVWIAATLSKRDCELACDEKALKTLGEDQRLAYGKTLLDMVSSLPAPGQLLETATAMHETKKQLKERMTCIVKKPKAFLTAAIVLLLVLTIVTGCTFSGIGAETTANAGISYYGLPAISPQLKQEIEAVYAKKFENVPSILGDISWEEHQSPNDSNLYFELIRYYGTYDGWSIFYFGFGITPTWVIDLRIGGVYFGQGAAVFIDAYKDGELLSLNAAYNAGYVSVETLETVADLHVQRTLECQLKQCQLYNEQHPDKSPRELPQWLKEYQEQGKRPATIPVPAPVVTKPIATTTTVPTTTVPTTTVPTTTVPTTTVPTTTVPEDPELAYFNSLLRSPALSDGNTRNYYNYALGQEYASPMELDLREFFGNGFRDEPDVTEAELTELKQYCDPFWVDLADCFRLPKGRMDTELRECFGISLADLPEAAFRNLTYLESTNSYYFLATSVHGIAELFQIKSVVHPDSNTIQVIYSKATFPQRDLVVTLQPKDEGYQVLSNTYLPGATEDPDVMSYMDNVILDGASFAEDPAKALSVEFHADNRISVKYALKSTGQKGTLILKPHGVTMTIVSNTLDS